VIVGSNTGVLSDFDGNYSINAKKGDILEFSYVGMSTQRITVADNLIIDIKMTDDISNLEEVVVVGYGKRERKTISGAVAQVSGEILENRPITNVVNGLQGTIPGLTISRSSGQPGSEGYSLQIRGASSLSSGGNSPLILVDGVDFSDLNLLNPNDIKTVTVLKDASATIYGARAAGGVILITTKSGGKKMAPQVNFTSNFSMNRLSNLLDKVNTREWVEMDWEAKTNAGQSPQFGSIGTLEEVLALIDAGDSPPIRDGASNAFLFFEGADWDDLIFDYGMQLNYNLDIRGGGEKSTYFTSASYTKTEGILKDAWDSSERANLRLNYGYDITDHIHLDSRIGYIYERILQPGAGNVNEIFAQLNQVFQFFPNRTKSGEHYLTQWGFQNPRQLADRDAGKSTTTKDNFSANFELSIDLIRDLQLKTQAGLERSHERFTRFTNIVKRWSWEDIPEGFNSSRNSAVEAYSQETYKNLTAYLYYRKVLENNDLSLMVGVSHEEFDNNSFNGLTRDFSQTQITTLNQGVDEEDRVSAGGFDWAIKSVFSRLTYIYNSKYIAEINFRRDGTSVFSSNERWGNFGGASLAWVLSDESFIENLNVFDNLKFRISYGVTGNQSFDRNQAGVGNLYNYIPLVNIGGNYPFGPSGSSASVATEGQLVTSQRRWENVSIGNVGLDFSFFNSRLAGSVDFFKKENNDMLLGVNLPQVLGGNPPALNIGDLEIKGFELSLNWTDKPTEDFSYAIGVNLSDNINKLVNLDGRDSVRLGLKGSREGYSQNTYFGYVFDGFIQNQEELDEYKKLDDVPTNIGIGDTRYKDINGDGRISVSDDEGNDADIVNLGTNLARYSYGFNFSTQYKNFDFSAFIQGVAKRTLFYSGNFRMPFEQPWWQPLRRFYKNTWTPENRDAKYPKLTTDNIRYWNYNPSEIHKVSGAYARLKNITFGYSIPKYAISKIGVEKIRIYFSGEDLFTIDSVDGGYDAENTNGGDRFYPFTKRYSIGLNLTF